MPLLQDTYENLRQRTLQLEEDKKRLGLWADLMAACVCFVNPSLILQAWPRGVGQHLGMQSVSATCLR